MKAFPSTTKNSSKPHDFYHGMDLRDYFAAKAMQALLEFDKDDDEAWVVERAYEYADAMMKARQL